MSVLMRDYFQNPTIVRAGLLSVSLGHLTDLSLLLSSPPVFTVKMSAVSP